MEHLSEERLLELAESGLEDDHLRYCRECNDAVEEQRAALAALRAAPLLELPAGRVREIVAELPDQTPVRRLRGWPRRLVIFAPVAAAAGALLVVSVNEESAREEAEPAVALSAPAQEDAGDASAQSKRAGAPEAAALALQRDFLLAFDDRAGARRAARELAALGFRTSVEPWENDRWLTQAHKTLTDPQVARAQQQVRAAARRHGGEYLGGQDS